MAVTRIAEELHRCASSRRAMERLRGARICNGKASSRCVQICKGEAPICCGTDALSSGKAVLCDGKERQRVAMAERRKALELLGYAPHCVGLAAKGRAKAQKSAARGKCIEKQGHREDLSTTALYATELLRCAVIGRATELHCCVSHWR